MSTILGIDSSSTDLSIGVYRDGAPVASFTRYIGNSHAEHIAPAVSMLLGSGSLQPEAVERIAVATGPGSFTGLRIGIAFVKGICTAHPIPVLPVSSLQILASAALRHNGRIVAAIDARNNDVFWASFSRQENRLARRTDDTIASAEQFTAALSAGDIVVTDTVGYKKSTVFTSLPAFCTSLPVEHHPLQRGLLCAASGVDALSTPELWVHHGDIHPNYLRRSAPEERLAAADGK
jgi:tRNA threonylcarbamoyladenosine biosynthesis protein TsaB